MDEKMINTVYAFTGAQLYALLKIALMRLDEYRRDKKTHPYERILNLLLDGLETERRLFGQRQINKMDMQLTLDGVPARMQIAFKCKKCSPEAKPQAIKLVAINLRQIVRDLHAEGCDGIADLEFTLEVTEDAAADQQQNGG
jgi:hypothetical protein